MTIYVIGHEATYLAPGGLFDTPVIGLATAGTGPEATLYTLTGPMGLSVQAYRMDAGGLTLLDQWAIPGNLSLGALDGPGVLDLPGGPVLAVPGAGGAGYLAVALDAGGFAGPADLSGDLPLASLSHLEVADTGGGQMLYGLTPGSARVQVWQLADGILTAVQTDTGPVIGAPRLTGLAVAPSGVVLTASAQDDALIAYAPGGTEEVARLGAADGIGIAAPSALTLISAHGEDFALMTASGSGTLSVVAIAAGGTLTLRDHVMDGLGSRFAQATVLDALTIGARAYVAVAGADDGLTLFELLPGGHLLHLASLADSPAMTLRAISDIALSVAGDTLRIAVGSAIEPGVTLLGFDPAAGGIVRAGDPGGGAVTGTAQGDLLNGGAGADTLSGLGGQDVLMDGGGSDLLRGGDGADVFVLTADGLTDTIADFQPGIDRIDLSAWPFLRSAAQLDIAPLAGGVALRFGDEVLRILTAGGQAITAEEVRAMDLLGIGRMLPDWPLPTTGNGGDEPPPGPPPEPEPEPGPGPKNQQGTDGTDFLIGAGLNDTLSGGAGDDTLTGLGGADSLIGGAQNDQVFGNAGSDLLYGQSGDDTIHGGIGWDTVQGGDGNDEIHANDGYDSVSGGGQNDTIWGNNGFDTLAGDNGDDLLDGGLSPDLLLGGMGHDLLYGAAGSDTLDGGSGNDTLNGNAGRDLLAGGTGADLLTGGINHDTLHGGAGDDRLNGGNGADMLFGEDGADRLEGNAGPDTLDGGAGDDILRGGIGADVFVFAAGDDRIVDFQDDFDTLLFDAAALVAHGTTVQALLAHAQGIGGGVLFDFAPGLSLLVTGVDAPADLADDIGFF